MQILRIVEALAGALVVPADSGTGKASSLAAFLPDDALESVSPHSVRSLTFSLEAFET